MRWKFSQFMKPAGVKNTGLPLKSFQHLYLLGVLGRGRHHRFHRIGVPGVHELRLDGLVVLEAADALAELGHADVGGVGDLALAVHHRLHGDGRVGVGLHGDGVFAAERLLDDLRHRGGDRVAVGADLRRGPAQRLALLRVGRLRRGKRQQRRDRQRGRRRDARPFSSSSSILLPMTVRSVRSAAKLAAEAPLNPSSPTLTPANSLECAGMATDLCAASVDRLAPITF